MPIPQSVAEADQRAVFASWLEDRRAQSGVSKSALAWNALRHDTTQQLNKFLRGEALPMPKTLKALCKHTGTSWPAAFALAGYYAELVYALGALARLARQWRADDATYPTDDAEFRSTGVLKVGDKIIIEALNGPRIAARYHMGCYRERPHEIDVDSAIPEVAAKIYRQEAANPQPVCCVVPKPLAIALMIATVGFPRRGDIYKDGASVYAANLLESAQAIIDHAIASVRSPLPALLQTAVTILKTKDLDLDTRRIMAAEVMLKWADLLCGRYTHYARLGGFEYWGEAGSSLSTVTPFVQMPQIRIAELPSIEELTKTAVN